MKKKIISIKILKPLSNIKIHIDYENDIDCLKQSYKKVYQSTIENNSLLITWNKNLNQNFDSFSSIEKI
jgi:hypothetical protein